MDNFFFFFLITDSDRGREWFTKKVLLLFSCRVCFLNYSKPILKYFSVRKFEKTRFESVCFLEPVTFPSRHSLSSFKVPFSVNLSSAPQANGLE